MSGHVVKIGTYFDLYLFHWKLNIKLISKMTTKSLIAQKLLDWYEERELLWNITCEEYRARNKKMQHIKKEPLNWE